MCVIWCVMILYLGGVGIPDSFTLWGHLESLHKVKCNFDFKKKKCGERGQIILLLLLRSRTEIDLGVDMAIVICIVNMS